MSTPLRQAQDEVGAVWGEIGGHPVVRHYGDSRAEYQVVRTAAGVADRLDKARIRLWGKDPVRMVQGLITNDLAGAPPERGVYAALLTPKGRTLAELRAFRRGSEVLLDLPREAMGGTTEHLRKFVPPMFARWADVSDETSCLGIYGPRALETLRGALGEIPALGEDGRHDATWEHQPLLVVGTRDAGGEDGYDLFAAVSVLPGLWDALLAAGAKPVGFDALEVLRIEIGRPRYGAELTEETIPTEAWESTGLMSRGISFTKGCYTGQEVIIRIAHRGHVNRHLRGLLLGDAPAPIERTPLLHPDTARQVGWTTSAVFSPLLQQTVALGYVRREVTPGSLVQVGNANAMVVELPFARP
jgi:folate-binding protein YgfZ